MIIKSFIFFITFLFSISSQSIYAFDNPLVGEWVSYSRTNGGLGGSKIYLEDGTVIVHFGALIDLKYKIDGNVLSLIDSNGKIFSKNEFKFSDSILVLKDIECGKETKLTRVKGNGRTNIVGKWVGDHYTGGKQCLHFTKALNCYFSVPMVQTIGRYKILGDICIEEFKNKDRTEWRVSFKNDILVLAKSDGSKTEEYIKKK